MWTPWYIAAFICGIFMVIICALSYLFSNRKITLVFRLSFDAISVVYGIFVYLATGAGAIWPVVIVDFIGIARDIIYMLRENTKWADHIFWLFLFEALFVGSAFFNLKEFPLALLPVVGSLINNVGLYLRDVKKTKIIILFGQAAFIVYYVLLLEATDALSILALISSSLFFLSAAIGLMAIKVKEKRNKTPKSFSE